MNDPMFETCNNEEDLHCVKSALHSDEILRPIIKSDFSEIFLNPQLLIFIACFLLFLNANRLVRNTAVFYSGGAIVGVFSSLIVIAFVLQKILPRRALSFPLYLGGWPLSFYIYYKGWQNFGLLILNYRWYLAIYVGVVLLISFAVCYRFGPPSNVRTINLIQWAFQLLALIGIYFSCNVKAIAIIIIFFLVSWSFWVMIYKFFNNASKKVFKWLRIKFFGVTPRPLLSQAEYEAEAKIYTQLELEKLREFCRKSPATKSWRTISRLSNPHRMASFITGQSEHVTSNEESEHASISWPDEDDDNDVLDQDILVSKEKLFTDINNTGYSSDFVTDDDD